MEIIVGYIFGVLYFKCMFVYSLESPHRGDSNNTHSIHLQDKRRKSP